ncbi:ornithine cyclodeaminase family protein [Candidatus Palauibacter sp.]|uniref:ornithine cyclodeaminase family protein n=1 Tax=Candidatus Palauibacter sp. TaxID=3101350 RepID=UPI003B59165F
MTIRILSRDDIERAVDAAASVDAMRVAFGELSAGRAVVPVRGHVESARGITLLMPAFLGASGGLGAKIVSVFPGNAALGQPSIQGAVILLDAETGSVRALLDGASLTEIRTAAGSGLATELLADPDADVLAVFGAGAQGRSHTELLAATRQLSEIRIVSVPPEGAESLAAELSARADELVPPGGGRPPRIRAAATPAEALDGATLVVTATTSETPVFSPELLEHGAHVNAIGAFQPHTREIPGEIVTRARVVVDQREAIWEEAGDLIIPVEEGLVGRDVIAADLGEIVNGDAPGGRGDFDFTLFESVGNAAQDVAIAEAALIRAEALGLGSVVPF